MASAPIRDRPRLSVELFRRFLEERPHGERWELIDGVAVMMVPPSYAHLQIASNLQFLLRASLQLHAPERAAFQEGGVNLGPSLQHYDPEPDVVVVDTELMRQSGKRYADRFYLAAEVVSPSDRTWVETKRELYKLHADCKYILTIQQGRIEVRVDTRTDPGSTEQLLTKLDDLVVLPDFGLRCKVFDLYRGTSLAPRDDCA
jgi:Uma2 family endonuclease